VIRQYAETRCPHCPVATGSPCIGVEIPRLCELVDPKHSAYNPAYVSLLLRGRGNYLERSEGKSEHVTPSLSESLALLRRMNECGDRLVLTDCGCAELARCARGRGRQGLVNHLDCFKCIRADAKRLVSL
jgi:hypothetical protein